MDNTPTATTEEEDGVDEKYSNHVALQWDDDNADSLIGTITTNLITRSRLMLSSVVPSDVAASRRSRNRIERDTRVDYATVCSNS
jgi:hypothetical protein